MPPWDSTSSRATVQPDAQALTGVVQQIGEDLAEPDRICMDGQRGRLQLQRERLVPLCNRRMEGRDHRVEDVAQRDGDTFQPDLADTRAGAVYLGVERGEHEPLVGVAQGAP